MTDDPELQPQPPSTPVAPEPAQSYAEKYAGTPWGRPTAPAPPPPPARSRTPLAIVGVAVLAIAIAGAGLVYLAVSPGGSTGSTTQTGATGTLPSLAAGVATPTPAPTPDPGQVVLDKFWKLVSDPNASYHMTASGKSTINRKTYQTFKQSIDVVGDEYSGWIDSKVSPKARIARKDGVVWVKVPGKARVGRQTSARYYRLTPFLYLEMAAWMDYVKPVTVGGRHLHLLRSNKFYRPDIARLLDLGKFVVVPDKMNLDVLVTDAGVPVSAVFTADVTVGNARQQRFHGKTTFGFSKFGDKLRISVPKR